MAESSLQSFAVSDHSFGSRFIDSATPAVSRSAYPIPGDERGTYESLRLMACAVLGEMEPDYSGYRDECNYRVAIEIVSGLGVTNWGSRQNDSIAALFNFVRDQIDYIDHPPYQQVVQDCRRTLQFRSGDCVSKSVCLSTLLGALQIETQFVAQHPAPESSFTHVYVELIDGTALDSICDGKQGRPLFQVGDRHHIPDNGFEMSWKIFQ